jgi:hypothetical protein
MRAALLLAGLAGCAGGMTEPPPGDGRLTLGTIAADGSFAPLTEGQDTTLVEGAQGGFHVWMKFRAHDVPAGDATLYRTAHRLSDEKLVLRTQGAQTMGAPDADGYWELPAALPMFMCPSPIGISVIDVPITFEIAVEGAGGRASGEVTLVPRCPAENADFCQRICTG